MAFFARTLYQLQINDVNRTLRIDVFQSDWQVHLLNRIDFTSVLLVPARDGKCKGQLGVPQLVLTPTIKF